MDKKQRQLLELLKNAMTGGETADEQFDTGMFEMADLHKVVPLLYDGIMSRNAAGTLRDRFQTVTDRTVTQWYRLLLETVRVIRLFTERGIGAVVLKGTAASSFYPVPEYRKAGDIDLLLTEPAQLKEAIEFLKKHGYRVSKNQHALHHVVMDGPGGVILELHTMIAEPFDNTKINQYMESLLPDIAEHVTQKEIAGFRLPILDDKYQAYELLLHMLQHFLREGFGLKLLCDWVAYWNGKDGEEWDTCIAEYRKLVKESRILGFSDLISAACRYYLGLKDSVYRKLTEGRNTAGADRKDAEVFLEEIFRSGEFGKNERGRMVMLRDTGLFAYVREFHHQMHLNFPKAGKVFLIWPALWIFTLGRFLKNNRKLRKVSSREIFESARERSELMKRMKLWR